MRPRLTPRQIWAMPVMLGALSTVGLTAALFSESAGDAVAWVALAVPTGIAIRAISGAARAPESG